jgi:hypothetical protein
MVSLSREENHSDNQAFGDKDSEKERTLSLKP